MPTRFTRIRRTNANWLESPMHFALAFVTVAALSAVVAHAGTPPDRYNRAGNNVEGSEPQRISNKDGYVADPSKADGKFDPYTQGARQSTGSALTDSKTKPAKKQNSKTAPVKPAP
jgi:hypothetical protein